MFNKREYQKNYSRVNRDKINAYKRLNNAKRVAYNKEYREKNKDKVIKWSRKNYEKNNIKILLRNKLYAAANKEKIRAAKRIYEARNKEAIRRKKHEYYMTNKEKVYLSRKEYVKKNIEQIQKNQRRWRGNNTFKMRAYRKKWVIENKLKNYLCQHNNRLKRKNVGLISISDAQDIYEKNIKHYGTLTCYLCGNKIDFGQDSIDHIIPISRGGNSDKGNLAICHIICNSRKSYRPLNDELKKELQEAFVR